MGGFAMSSGTRDFGHAIVSPAEAVAGQRGTWRVIYTVGAAGMAVGGSLRLRPPQRGMVRWEVGHVIAEAGRSGAVCEVRLVNCWPLTYHWRQTPIIQVDLWGEALRPGDTITVTLGDRGAYSRGFFLRARAQDHAQDDALWDFWADVEGNKSVPPEAAHNDPYVALEPFVMRVRPAAPARLSVVARQPADDSDEARVVIAVRDAYENLCDGYAGEVSLEVGERQVRVALAGGIGHCAVPAEPGPCYLSALDREGELIGLSNPLFPCFSRAETMPAGAEDFPAAGPVFFGDLHVMSGAGIIAGALRGTPEAYTWARDVAGLDFCAVTNNLRTWERDLELDDEFHEPGSFITIPACELGFAIGHKNVYFPDTGAARPAPDGSSPEALFASLEGRTALVIPHHTNIHSESSYRTFWTEHDFTSHAPRVERLIEMCQDRGSFEREEVGGNIYFGGLGSSVWSALQRGMKLGFVGGTDTHRALPSEWRSPLGGLDVDEGLAIGGLTGLIAPALTREALWEALWHRRCYATQGQRTLVNFALAEYPLGSVLSAEQAAPFTDRRTFRYRVQGHRPVVRVELVRCDGRAFDLAPEGEPGRATVTGVFEDATALADLPRAGDAVFYYLRVTEADGRMAWSSPIWLTTRSDA